VPVKDFGKKPDVPVGWGFADEKKPAKAKKPARGGHEMYEDTIRQMARLSAAKSAAAEQHKQPSPPAAAPASAAAPPAVAPVSELDPLAKRIRNLRKKLREIDELAQKAAAGGDVLTPEQREKVARRDAVLEEIAELEKQHAHA
jgi:uncharacterized protein with WD repeat